MTPRRPPEPVRRRSRNDARATKASGEAVENAENGRVIPLSAPPASNGPAQGTDRPGDNTQADGHGPARGYSWPAFQPGHRLSVKAGAYSPSIVAERAAEVHAHLLTVAPYLDVDVFLPQVDRYLRAAAIESLLDEYVVAKGIESCAPRMIEQLHTARRLARDMAIELGLSPRGRAELATLLAGASRAEQSLADLRAEGARILRGAERRLAAVPTDVPTERGKP